MTTTYLQALVAFNNTLTDSNHPNIPLPPPPSGAGGVTAAQADKGCGRLDDLPGFVFPGGGNSMGSFQPGPSPSATYTDYLTGVSKWQEIWIFRDLALAQSGPAALLWSYVSGVQWTPAERAALIVEANAAGKVYQIADERFTYKLLPQANDNSLKKPAGQASTDTLYHLWQVTNNTVSAAPVGALFSQQLSPQAKTVDNWLLKAGYQPPAGTTKVLFQKIAAAPVDVYDYFQAYLFGAAPVGSLAGGRYVQVPFTTSALV